MSIDVFIVPCIHLSRMISLSRRQLPHFQFLVALPDHTMHTTSIPSMSEMWLGRGSCPLRLRFILILIILILIILILIILIILILIVLILIVLILIILILIVLILIVHSHRPYLHCPHPHHSPSHP